MAVRVVLAAVAYFLGRTPAWATTAEDLIAAADVKTDVTTRSTLSDANNLWISWRLSYGGVVTHRGPGGEKSLVILKAKGDITEESAQSLRSVTARIHFASLVAAL